MTGPVWCTGCGRHMVKSFMMLALVCPDECGTMITQERLDVLDELFEPEPSAMRRWVRRELEAAYARALRRELDRWIGIPWGITGWISEPTVQIKIVTI